MDRSEISPDTPRNRRRMALATALAAFALGGCTELFTPTHAGELEHNVVWAGVHRLTDDLVVQGASLRLECGARIEAEPGVTIHVRDGGQIVSSGRPGCPVTWTRADSAGHWNGLSVERGGTFAGAFSRISYAGRYGAAMHVERGGRVDLYETAIRHSADDGLSVDDEGRIARADRLEFSEIHGLSLRVPASELGAIQRPAIDESAGRIVAHGGLIDRRTSWDFPNRSIELVDDVRVRDRLEITAETRVEFGIGARMSIEAGGRLRAVGNARLGYDARHRYVRLSFQPGSSIAFREDAGSGSRLEWVLFEGPAARPTPPLHVADPAAVTVARSFRSATDCTGLARRESPDTCG